MHAVARKSSIQAHVDLESLREMLLYAIDETSRAKSLSRLTSALAMAAGEIELAQRQTSANDVKHYGAACFVPLATPVDRLNAVPEMQRGEAKPGSGAQRRMNRLVAPSPRHEQLVEADRRLLSNEIEIYLQARKS